jgi:hypothetical protein
VKNGKLTASTALQPLQHFAELHFRQLLNSVLHVSQLIAQQRQFVQILIQLIPLFQERTTHNLVQVEVPGLEGLVHAGYSVHLVVMRTVD